MEEDIKNMKLSPLPSTQSSSLLQKTVNSSMSSLPGFFLCIDIYAHVDPGIYSIFSSVQSLSRVRLFETPWIVAHQASLSITNSRSSLRLTSIVSVMPSSHLILCRPLILLPPIPPSIRVFSNELTLHMRWPKYWSFSFSITPLISRPRQIPNLFILSNDLLPF